MCIRDSLRTVQRQHCGRVDVEGYSSGAGPNIFFPGVVPSQEMKTGVQEGGLSVGKLSVLVGAYGRSFLARAVFQGQLQSPRRREGRGLQPSLEGGALSSPYPARSVYRQDYEVLGRQESAAVGGEQWAVP